MTVEWRYAVIQHLENFIFGAELRRLRRVEVELVSQNKKLSGLSDGFFYKEVLYSDLDPSIRSRGTKGNLHPSLIPQAEAHYQDEKTIAFDRIRVKQALALLLRDCRSLQDVRDALPKSLRDGYFPIQALERTREEGFTVKDNPRAYRQYLKLRDKIEFYNASKLLY
jgi:hypothetical protein